MTKNMKALTADKGIKLEKDAVSKRKPTYETHSMMLPIQLCLAFYS